MEIFSQEPWLRKTFDGTLNGKLDLVRWLCYCAIIIVNTTKMLTKMIDILTIIAMVAVLIYLFVELAPVREVTFSIFNTSAYGF